MKETNVPFILLIGLECKVLSSLKSTFAGNIPHYDFLVIPLIHPLQYRSCTITRSLPLTYSGTSFFVFYRFSIEE